MRESHLSISELIQQLKREPNLEPVKPIFTAINALAAHLNTLNKPLIGFAGSPFTVACYLIEQGSSKTFSRVKELIESDPSSLHSILNSLTDLSIHHLKEQYKAGVRVIQLFDTWSQTIKKMGSFRVHQKYFPHDMDVLYQRTLRLEQTKRDFLKMYKNASHFLNYEHVLKNYFSTNMTGDLSEQNLAIKHTMKMLYSDRDQDHLKESYRLLVL